LSLFTVHDAAGTAVECVSRLYLGAKLAHDLSDKPAPGLGCEVQEVQAPHHAYRLRLGSREVKGVAVRDMYLHGRVLSLEEIQLASKRTPWNRWVTDRT